MSEQKPEEKKTKKSYLKRGIGFGGKLLKKAKDNPEVVGGVTVGVFVADILDSLTFGLAGGIVGAMLGHAAGEMTKDDDMMEKKSEDN